MISLFLYRYAAEFFTFLSGLLPESIRNLPDWVVTGWHYILDAVGQAVYLLSWLFPSGLVFTAFVYLASDVGLLCIGIRFFHTITNLVHKFKSS